MTDGSKNILKVKNLSNTYAGKPLLQNISFSLNKGEILCLLGPSGSGKTTLLRLLAGLETEDEGTIFFQDRDIKPIPSHKRNVGMMFEEYALFPHKTVRDNVAFGLEMQKCSTEIKNSKIAKMLSLVGLDGFDHRKINELSGGERQRVALARSLAPEPQLLLLDEPLGSLDRTLRDRLTGEIRSILKAIGVTAVFVTHDQSEAFSVADKVAILNGGILQQFDTPENIYRFPQNTTVAQFLGFSNLIEGEIQNPDTFVSSFGEFQLPESQTNENATILLIRPDGARISHQHDTLETQQIISGVVKDIIFLGSNYRLYIEVGPILLLFDLPIDPKPPAVNEPITLCLNTSALVTIEK